ncbi:MAG TPA: hypothetical protein VNJ04_15835 [Gemmatimonadaceae bacterium]|nr:hypothetical protein [Gemmatimonadaceae bacterium]
MAGYISPAAPSRIRKIALSTFPGATKARTPKPSIDKMSVRPT